MSTIVKIGGKSYIEPGAYAFTKYNPTSANNVSSFGNVLIIDTNKYGSDSIGTEFSGGSGINGELNKGIKSVYEFSNIEDFRKFTSGGKLTDVVRKVFDPMSGTNLEGISGAPRIYYVRAATTTAASTTIPINNDADSNINLICKNEGEIGNSVYNGGSLKTGYSVVLTSVTDTTFRVKILRGTYEGSDSNNEPFGNYSLEKSYPEVIFDTDEIEIKTAGNVRDALMKDKNIKALFNIEVGEQFSESALITSENVDTYEFSGGTSDYTGQLSKVFEAITELDYNFVLCLDEGIDVNNQSILTHLKTNAKFGAVAFIPAKNSNDGSDLNDILSTTKIPQYFNSEQVVCTYGSPIVTRRDGNGNKVLDSIYLTASILGLVAGNSPQTPITFKRIGYQNFLYDLTKKERENALQLGLMHVRNISGYWCVNQGITTVQDNLNAIALDGQTCELSIVNIKNQINKELILEGEKRFIGNSVAQSSTESIKNFTETKLASLIATPGNDNLIISWKNVKVTVSNGDSTVTYDFVPNVPLNKVFFIGNMLDFKF